MTAVAGDFYEFIPVDEKRVGILVADVPGAACQQRLSRA
jgi:phosphoserine phosphatase RsbU/P